MPRSFNLIVNPVAGPRNNESYLRRLAAHLEERLSDYKVFVTKHSGHATEIVEREKENSNATFVSIGGDGTFNEVASALVGSERNIAHIPRGSGNGLARMLKIPAQIEEIPDYLLKGEVKQIDVGQLNNDYFFCTCGFGFDALIASDFETTPIRGFWGYVAYVLKEFSTYKGVEATLQLDGETISGRFFTVTFANANQYGNDAFIAPLANLEDGWLDVTLIRPFPMFMAPLMIWGLMSKKIHKLPYVKTRRVKSVEIKSISSSHFHCDGDVYPSSLPLKITLKEKALRLLVPAKN